MRLLLVSILAAAALWSGVWWFGARGVDRDLSGWIEGRRDAGWVADVRDVRTGGFPNRFDTTLDDVALADPATGIAWTAPFLQLFRLSYQPRHAIVVWPGEQLLSTPNQRITITNADARGSFVFKRDETWPLDRATVTAESVGLASSDGWTASMALARLATRPSTRVQGAVDVGLYIAEFRPANALVSDAAELGLLPAAVERIELDAAITFDAPWDRRAIEVARPKITALDIQLAQVAWGAVELHAAGQVALDDRGRPTGEITLRLTNWRDLLALARLDTLPPGIANRIATGVELLAGLAGPSDTFDMPLSFATGRVSLGPIPLGEIAFFLTR